MNNPGTPVVLKWSVSLVNVTDNYKVLCNMKAFMFTSSPGSRHLYLNRERSYVSVTPFISRNYFYNGNTFKRLRVVTLNE